MWKYIDIIQTSYTACSSGRHEVEHEHLKTLVSFVVDNSLKVLWCMYRLVKKWAPTEVSYEFGQERSGWETHVYWPHILAYILHTRSSYTNTNLQACVATILI